MTVPITTGGISRAPLVSKILIQNAGDVLSVGMLPSSSMIDAMKLRDLRTMTLLWKNLELLSPSASHITLDFCLLALGAVKSCDTQSHRRPGWVFSNSYPGEKEKRNCLRASSSER